MKEFQVLKTYYIHDFKAIQDWFGNRGTEIKRKDIKEWCYDGDFLYFVPTEHADNELVPETLGNVLYCTFDSLYFEIEAEIDYKNSPFANKINKGAIK